MPAEQLICCLETQYLQMDLNNRSEIVSIRDREDDTEYRPQTRGAALLRVASGGDTLAPVSSTYDDENQQLRLLFSSDLSAIVSIITRPTHLTFELTSLEGECPTHAVWGPIPTTIGGMIGETVGVVRNERFAFGIQALNIHTSGGFPEGYPESGGENDAATATDTGSEVRAYSRATDGGVLHSKIALFGCPDALALETIGRIEIDEGLPHPMLDGEWCKTGRTARSSYLITAFGEETVDEAIRYTQMAGFNYFYHEDPFETWGRFKLRPSDFPSGDAGLKQCVDRAAASGLRIGIHTLSNFMTTNDAYVTPMPEPRLMRSGTSRLTERVDAESTEIPIADGGPFQDRGTVSAAVVGNELIRYRAVSNEAPWRLLGCRRAAFGTKAEAYESGTEVGKLADHPYGVFFPNLSLQDELANRLVELYNVTGLRQISFDGLEGCAMTGHGIYAHNRFVTKCFDGWKSEVLNDASRLTHYLWHIHTRMNWGEPWGKATREGQIEHRIINQEYFERNLFPRMFGWFQLRLASGDLEATSLDDMEWVLSKCAGYDSGFALSASLAALKGNGQANSILMAAKQWERARLDHSFTEKQVRKLRDPARDFHLEPDGEAQWRLYPVVYSPTYTYREIILQPGEPGEAEWTFDNPHEDQPYRFILRTLPDVGVINEDTVVNPVFEINFSEAVVPVRLCPYQYLVCEGDGVCTVYDINWNPLQTVDLPPAWPTIVHGENQILFWFGESSKCSVEIRIKAVGPWDRVGR